jgi:hypothetical protein
LSKLYTGYLKFNLINTYNFNRLTMETNTVENMPTNLNVDSNAPLPAHQSRPRAIDGRDPNAGVALPSLIQQPKGM